MQKFIISIIGCEFVGVIATPFTLRAIPTWYVNLNKPFFSPPNWIFGPVWTTLYFLMGVSVFLIWKKGLKRKETKRALLFFLSQLFLNFIWSLLFFGLHSLLLGLLDILLLIISLVITMTAFYKISRTAAYLLVAYFLWVSFAVILNFSLVVLNP